ncbi:MAG: ABC transporter ATP-binding protein [Lachnospiraceae bacterium]
MLELQNVSYIVEDGRTILDNINLKIDDRFVVITGPNGSGKSTLAKIIAGIIRPTGGRIFFDGVDITDMNITERAKQGMSYAFQQPVRFKGLRVKDLLALAAGKEARFSELCDMLSEVGLCAKEYIHRDLDDSLSGGELKRIEIAMILARNSRLSIFDEPEAGIDLWSFQKLIGVFEKMAAANNGNILIISHQERILDIADKIIYLRDGRIEKFDKKENILPDLLNSAGSGSCHVLTSKMKEGN